MQLRTQTFFPSFAPSPWICWPPPSRSTVFLLFLPLPPGQLGIHMRIYSSHRLVILFVWSTLLLAGHIILLVLRRRQTAKESCHRTHGGVGPSAWLSSLRNPIKIGSLATFTKSASHVIELVQRYESALMVKWVFSFLTLVESHWAFALVPLLLSPVITSNEKRKGLLIWKKKEKHQLQTRCSCFPCIWTVQLQPAGSNVIPLWYSGLYWLRRMRLSVTSNNCQVGDTYLTT